MKHPFRENLEVYVDGGRASIRCIKCCHIFCRFGEDWESNCKRRLLPPTKAGVLMSALEGCFMLEQLYCPGCATLLKTEIVEAKKEEKEGQRQQVKA